MDKFHLHLILGAAFLAAATLPVAIWVHSAASRLEAAEAAGESSSAQVAIASASDKDYCTGELKPILRRVLTSCGLVKGGSSRGCQPLDAKTVAAMSGSDFNALFLPLADRAAIIQFEKDSAELDAAGTELLDGTFSDQRGASYFLVVSRASPEGSVSHNRELSRQRAESVLEHLMISYHDPDLEQEVGLLWLGEEFAQLDKEFCQWKRSHGESPCTSEELNRSAFVAWIDCRL